MLEHATQTNLKLSILLKIFCNLFAKKTSLRLQTEVCPPCEVKLVEKLTELLNSLKPMEMTLKDSTRKAKTKLQREWSNFKEGYVWRHVFAHKIIIRHHFSQFHISSHIEMFIETQLKMPKFIPFGFDIWH